MPIQSADLDKPKRVLNSGGPYVRNNGNVLPNSHVKLIPTDNIKKKKSKKNKKEK